MIQDQPVPGAGPAVVADQLEGTAWYATGEAARQAGPVGEVLAESIPVSFDGTAQPPGVSGFRLFAGLRSDPFFADVEGALHGFQWTGHDDIADNNVDSIVLEVPHDMLGPGPVIGAWASISRYKDGALEQLDRGGNRPSTRSSTLTGRRTSSTPASPPTTWPTTWARDPRSWKTPVAARPRTPGPLPFRYCPTSCTTTGPSPPPTPTAASPPTTCTACASPG